MKIIKFIAIALVLTFTSGYTGFCQFHIIPYIDLEINVDPGYLYPPHQLMLVGMGDENKVVRHVEIKPGIRNYSVYDIKPGEYWLTIRDDNATILFQYQTVTIYDPVKEVFYSENTGYQNEIEAYRNRNLKLKIDFKMHEYYSGYQQVKEIKYRDFDYTELIFYSIPPSGELKAKMRTSSQADSSICGDNEGRTEKELGFKCSLDDGNIDIEIKKAYFENIYEGERPTGYQVGGTIFGPINPGDPNTEYYSGVCSVEGYLLDNEGGNNPHPGEWEDINVTAHCDGAKKKCKITIDYNLAIRMQTAVWQHEDMCKYIKSFDNKPLYDQQNSRKSQCYCDCYGKAIIAHEAKHCENWMAATDELKGILQDFCKNNQYTFRANSCCPEENGDEECQKQANEFKYSIFQPLNAAFNKAMEENSAEYSPEKDSDDAEKDKFKQCSNENRCKIK